MGSIILILIVLITLSWGMWKVSKKVWDRSDLYDAMDEDTNTDEDTE